MYIHKLQARMQARRYSQALSTYINFRMPIISQHIRYIQVHMWARASKGSHSNTVLTYIGNQRQWIIYTHAYIHSRWMFMTWLQTYLHACRHTRTHKDRPELIIIFSCPQNILWLSLERRSEWYICFMPNISLSLSFSGRLSNDLSMFFAKNNAFFFFSQKNLLMSCWFLKSNKKKNASKSANNFLSYKRTYTHRYNH